MVFSVNHPVLYLIVGLLVAVVLGQSVFFLVKALRRSKQLGMDQTKIKKTIRSAAIFTIAPCAGHRCQHCHPQQKAGSSPALVATERGRLHEL